MEDYATAAYSLIFTCEGFGMYKGATTFLETCKPAETCGEEEHEDNTYDRMLKLHSSSNHMLGLQMGQKQIYIKATCTSPLYENADLRENDRHLRHGISVTRKGFSSTNILQTAKRIRFILNYGR